MAASASKIHEKIQALKAAAENLAAAGEEIPAVVRNTARILASCRMLELEVCDLFDLNILDHPQSGSVSAPSAEGRTLQ